MKILFIAPRLPLPADTGGKIRTLNILKQLAKKADVHLVCFSFDKNDQNLSAPLRKLGVQVTLVPGQNPGFFNKVYNVLFGALPVTIQKYKSEEMESLLSELNETNEFDAVHVDHVHMANYQNCFNGIPHIIDEHNVEYKILERVVNVERSLVKRLVFGNQAKKMEEFEKKSIVSADAYFAVSQEDKNYLLQLGANEGNGHIAPNGVDTQFFNNHHGDPSMQEEAVVFTGSMDWLPNDDAAVYFCKDILPLIWEVKPNVKFYIIGKEPSGSLREMARADGRIVVTGRVDDVRTYVEQAKVFVVPLRIGGGTRLKILEAMSMQKAVVSTTVGAEGIHCTNDVNISIADDAKQFSGAVLALLSNDAKRKSLGIEGRKLVCDQYDWNIVGDKINRIYQDMIHVN